jgi:hypothetical protein
MSITNAVINYRKDRRRRGSTPAHLFLLETGLSSGYGFQRELEQSLSRRMRV